MYSKIIFLIAFGVSLWAGSAGAFSGDVWRDASLYRDEWGVPHVFAENPFSMAFVFGYAQAEDHAEHMLLAYRMANGRLAEVLGEPYAESDAFSLKMGHARLAGASLPGLDPVTREICEGFAMGINAWLVDHPESVPPWADGVQPQDILAFWHAFLMSMAPLDLPDIYRRPPAMATGNAWAVGPDRNPDKAAILVINPHQDHEGFFQWYEAHLVLGEMNVYGTTLRGLPVILQGHNAHLGWALTPNQSDFADIFREEYEPRESNPKDPGKSPDENSEQQVLLLHYMAHSVPFHVRTNGGVETRHVPAYIGDRGPLLEHGALGLHSWLIGGFYDFGGLRQLLEMGFSNNLDQFGAALAMHQIPCFHITYADQAGNILYLYNTKTGVRIAPVAGTEENPAPEIKYNWSEPVSHSLALIAWQDVLSLASLPCIVNPPSGFVQACGNPPWTATIPPVLNPASWPEWLAHDQDTYRAKRIRQLLQQGIRSFRDHQSILFDVVAPAAFDLVPALLKTVELRADIARTMHPDFWVGINLLKEWNYTAETVSPGMTFFHLWWNFCRTRAAGAFKLEQDFYAAIGQGTPAVQEILLRAVEDAARTLRNEFGTVEKNWGEVHRIRRGERNEPIPGAGSGDPVFISSDYAYAEGQWSSTYGYGFAMVVQFGEIPESVSLLPFGVSQVPGSPHFDDQLDLMLARQFKHVRFLPDDILRNAERATGKSLTLLPPGVSGAFTLHGNAIIHGRLNTKVEPPYPLPENMAPFCLYIQPERKPAGVPVHVEASIHIPEVLCDETFLGQLQLYRYEPGLDWHPAPAQQMNIVSRIITMQDTAPAEWYVVLGPLEAVSENPAPPEPTENSPYTPNHPVGLEALLNQHEAQTSITGRGRLFRLDRHVQESSGSQSPDGGAGEAPLQEAKDRVFNVERLDNSAENASPSEASPLTGIPGFHFGPGADAGKQESSGQQGRIFRMDRMDQINAPPVVSQEPPQINLEEGIAPPVVSQEPPQISPEAGNVPLTAGATLPEEPEEPGSDVSTVPETVENSPEPARLQPQETRSRPPLPETIPQDPAFVFGPSQEKRQEDVPENSPKRVFNIERMNR